MTVSSEIKETKVDIGALINQFSDKLHLTKSLIRSASWVAPEKTKVAGLIKFFSSEMAGTGITTESNDIKSCSYSPAIRGQRITNIAHRIPSGIEEMLDRKKTQIGRLELSYKPNKGIGGGILISDRHLLVNRHAIDTEELNNYRIRFDDLNPDTTFQVKNILAYEDAQKLGLQAGPDSDFIILELQPDSVGVYPGTENNYTPIKPLFGVKPEMLYYVGYTSGTHLHISSSPGRPIELTELNRRGTPVKHRLLVWNDQKTHGVIAEEAKLEKETKLHVATHAREHEFYVVEDCVYRKNGSLANAVNEHFVLYPNNYQDDHVLLAHTTGAGSCGGIYFTPEGEIFAVHCGRVFSEKKYPEHLARYPWIKNSRTVFDDRLIYEGKTAFSKYKEISKVPLGAAISVADMPDILGHITGIAKNTEGNVLQIQPKKSGSEIFTVTVPYSKLVDIPIGRERYPQTDVFIDAENIAPLKVAQKYPDALFKISLVDLTEGNTSDQIPQDIQRRIAQLIREKEISPTFSHNNIQYKHITIGGKSGSGKVTGQAQGSNYQFVIEGDELKNDTLIAFHAIGCHAENNSNPRYKISSASAAFEEAAIANKCLTKSAQTESSIINLRKK